VKRRRWSTKAQAASISGNDHHEKKGTGVDDEEEEAPAEDELDEDEELEEATQLPDTSTLAGHVLPPVQPALYIKSLVPVPRYHGGPWLV